MQEVVRFLHIEKHYEELSPGRLVCIAQIEKLSKGNKKSAAKASTQKSLKSLYHGKRR
jgi:hypothetical protein